MILLIVLVAMTGCVTSYALALLLEASPLLLLMYLGSIRSLSIVSGALGSIMAGYGACSIEDRPVTSLHELAHAAIEIEHESTFLEFVTLLGGYVTRQSMK